MINLNKSSSTLNPFLMWSDLAVQTSEMMMASVQVISHRTGRMAAAGVNPSVRDQREFQLMGREKLEAIAESAQAMAVQIVSVNPVLGLRALDLMMKSSGAMLSLASSTNFSQTLSSQAELTRVIAESANINSHLTNSAAKIAHHALQPIHSRATANAKRLSKI